MNKSVLVTLADKNFVDAAKQLFSSAYFNAGWKGDYMLLSIGIPDKELAWFRKKGILIKKYQFLKKNKIGTSKRNPVIISKFYLFKEEFKKWANVVYLDADIIVRAPIDKLAKVGGFCAAVRDLNSNKLSSQFCKERELSGKNLDLLRELKQRYDFNKPCFNAGVMAFNTKIIRNDTFSNLLNLFNRYSDIHTGSDQPTFNLFFYNQWKKLPIVYNVYASETKDYYGKIHPSKLKGIIFHILGKDNKPWFKESCFYNEWSSNLEKSEFMDLNKPQQGRKKWNLFKIYFYSYYLSLRIILSQRYYKIKTPLIKTTKKIKHLIYWRFFYFFGIAGKTIKKISPKLYFIFKKIKIIFNRQKNEK